MIKELLRDEEGQSTVEYMLLISVIVIAIVAAAYVFIEPFKQGVLDLGKDIKNNVACIEAARAGYGFGLGVAVRTEPGVAATNGNVGDYSWNGAYGTLFWVDPKEKLVVVTMTVGPGDIRKYYREQMAALVYGAMEK